MGEVAELILMGFLCQQCGMPVDGDAFGFPRCCDSCDNSEVQLEKVETKKER